MNSSSPQFQTSGLVLLASTLIFTIFGAVIIAPMLTQQSAPIVVTSAEPVAPLQQVPAQFAEFYPEQRAEPVRRPNVTPQMTPIPQNVPREWSQPARPEREVVSLSPEVMDIPYDDRQIYRSVSADGRGSRPAPRDVPTQQPYPEVPRLPSGSVYAPVTVHPVTVNVDSSLMDQQMHAMERRFEQFMQAQSTHAQSAERKPNRTAKKNRGRRNDDRKIVDSQLNELSADLQALIATVSSLEQQTKSNLNQVYRQNAASDAAALKRLKDWENVLNERLRAQEVAVRTVIASRPNTIVVDRPVPQPAPQPIPIQHTAPEQPVPVETVVPSFEPAPVERQPTPVATIQEGFTAPVPTRESVPTATVEEADAVPLPKPAPFVSRAPAVIKPEPERIEPQPAKVEAVPLPQTVIRSAELPPVIQDDFPTPSASIELAPVTKEFPVLEMKSPRSEPTPLTPFDPQSSVDSNARDDETDQVARSVSQTNDVSLPSQSLTLGNEPSVNSSRRSVAPVAFESVYRFTMSDDAETVVPVAGSQKSLAAAPQPSGQMTQPQEPPRKPSHPRDARGTLLPKLKVPSFKVSDDEPGVLHRIGSSIMKFGRRTID